MPEKPEVTLEELDAAAESLRMFKGSSEAFDPIDEEAKLTHRNLEIAIECVDAMRRIFRSDRDGTPLGD